MVIFLEEDTKTYITALKYFRDVILAGVGDHLHIFDRKNNKFLKKIRVFNGEEIYGIVPNDEQCILFSGPNIKIIQLNDYSIITSGSYFDWVLEALWIDAESFLTLSMHNKLQIWNSSLQLKLQKECESQCILYSGHIYSEDGKVAVFSGTVFSEILVWNAPSTVDGRCPVLKRLKGHKGVIFSINYNASVGKLCSTSDDRSAFLWFIDKHMLFTLNEDQEIHNIQVFGHESRIFRCKVLTNSFITAGEDSILNVWSHQGQLEKKIETSQGSPIWSLDCDKEENCLIAGGGDGAVKSFPLSFNHLEEKISLPNFEKSKVMGILDINCLVVVSEKRKLYYHIYSKNYWKEINYFEDTKNYVLLQISKCRKMIALAGYYGQINIYKKTGETLHLITEYQTKVKNRILSFHWITCNSFLICQNGMLTFFYYENKIPIPISIFKLPGSKERWTTCAVLVENNIVVGDRKGSIHLFELGVPKPLQTFKKVHSSLGVTNLVWKKDRLVSLGRDGLIKMFVIKEKKLILATSDKLPFNCLLNVIDNFVIGFTNDSFIIWDNINKRILFEQPCGSSHRSWNFYKENSDAMFCFIKKGIINMIRLDFDRLICSNIIFGFHLDAVNCIEIFDLKEGYMLISGGEDTTLRITLLKTCKFENVTILKSHLSSIRTINSYCVYENSSKSSWDYLTFSAGGRGQIICWKINIIRKSECFDIKCIEELSYYEPSNKEESEVRIMDLLVYKLDQLLILFSACSDGNIKIFTTHISNERYQLSFHKNIFYKLKCIMKLSVFSIFERHILVTMATDGYLMFWDISDILTSTVRHPLASLKIHQSGVNSYSSIILENGKVLFLTGGDDNAIVLSLVKFEMGKENGLSCKLISNFIDNGTHCAQVTGLYLSKHYFLSVSIDQRVALFSWAIIKESLVCKLFAKYNTPITDIKGLRCFEKSNVWDIILYGNGMEFLKMIT